jgi:[NiFe] hydrogenase assembly HybE family chaperone
MTAAVLSRQECAPAALISRLETVFFEIQTSRMADVPVLNSALQVEAVSFMSWREDWLGILITPWFMNLMLLPHIGKTWTGLVTGQTVVHTFPSGEYDFIVGQEAALGEYQSCSLFSPMFEFPDQACARATAQAALANLFAADAAQEAAVSMSRRRFLLGAADGR